MDCESCGKRVPEPVPYLAHEAAMARMERVIKRLWLALVLTLVLLVLTNGIWIWYESQWEDITVEQEVETDDGPAFVAGVGDINYGDSQADSQNPET